MSDSKNKRNLVSNINFYYNKRVQLLNASKIYLWTPYFYMCIRYATLSTKSYINICSFLCIIDRWIKSVLVNIKKFHTLEHFVVYPYIEK